MHQTARRAIWARSPTPSTSQTKRTSTLTFKLTFTDEAKGQLDNLKGDAKRLKRVRKCLGLIETNPRHPGLNSHKYNVMKTDGGKPVWESYVENKTPAAWRVFWSYGPEQDQITILTITEHP